MIDVYAGSVVGNVKIAKRVVEYERELDSDQKEMLRIVDRVAETGQYRLETVDLGKQSFLKTLFLGLLGQGQKEPGVIFSSASLPGILKLLASESNAGLEEKPAFTAPSPHLPQI